MAQTERILRVASSFEEAEQLDAQYASVRTIEERISAVAELRRM